MSTLFIFHGFELTVSIALTVLNVAFIRAVSRTLHGI